MRIPLEENDRLFMAYIIHCNIRDRHILFDTVEHALLFILLICHRAGDNTLPSKGPDLTENIDLVL